MAKFTPGPWEVLPDGFRVYKIIGGPSSVSDLTHICTTAHNAKERTDASRANGQLISAAPELLQVCKEILAHFAGTVGDNIALPIGSARYQKLKDAITKAEGD